MLERAKILFKRAQRYMRSTQRRSLDAAGGGRRWKDAPVMQTPGAIHADAARVAYRALHFALNNANGVRIVESLVSNIVGAGIVPMRMRPELKAVWDRWTDNADADCLTDFYGLQQSLLRDTIIFGEAIAVFVPDDEHGFKLRRLNPDQLDRSLSKNLPDGGYIYQGVEFDANGTRRAYHVRHHDMRAGLAGVYEAPSRIPASDFIHIFRPLVPGQVRGLSWLAAILLPAKELDALLDALLVRAKVAALHAGFITETDSGLPYDGTEKNGTLDVSLEPGAMVTLSPGKSVEFPAVPDQGNTNGLLTSTLRMIAAGVNVTYEQATGDYSQVNYSSARAALLEFRRFCEGVQHHQMVFALCRPVWNRFVREQVLRGVVSARDYLRDPASFETVKWLPPAWPWVDPLKDANAAAVQLQNRLCSRSEIIAERGYDAQDVDREIAADAKRLRDLGVSEIEQEVAA